MYFHVFIDDVDDLRSWWVREYELAQLEKRDREKDEKTGIRSAL
jgi:hypothetical protein